MILKDKIDSELSKFHRSEAFEVGGAFPLWEWKSLETLVAGKCNNTYQILDEVHKAGAFEFWLTLDLPWQSWL